MATFTGIGYSQHPDCQQAAFDAGLMVRKQLGETAADFILLFATSDYCKPQTLSALKSVITTKQLIGSSTTGIIVPNQIITRGVGVLAIKSDDVQFTTCALGVNPTSNMKTLGFDLTQHLTKFLPPSLHKQGCLIFGDGFYRHHQEFLKGISEVFGTSFPVIAGINSTDAFNKKNYQFYNDQILESALVSVLIAGTSKFCVEARHGYKLLGRPRIATKTYEHIVHTINDKPAIQLYEEFFNKTADDIRQDPLKPHQVYPLAFLDENTNQYLVRNPVDILADGSIVFYGDIPPNAHVHLLISNKEASLQSALNAAQALKNRIDPKIAEIILIIESHHRHKLLGHHAQQEIMNIRETIGFVTPAFGMYSNGEIASWPVRDGQHITSLNNGGLVLAALA